MQPETKLGQARAGAAGPNWQVPRATAGLRGRHDAILAERASDTPRRRKSPGEPLSKKENKNVKSRIDTGRRIRGHRDT